MKNNPIYKKLRLLIICMLFLLSACAPPVEQEIVDDIVENATEIAMEKDVVEESQEQGETATTNIEEIEKAEESLDIDSVQIENNTEVEEETESQTPSENAVASTVEGNVSLSDIPAYSGTPYVAINNNNPNFTDEDLTTTSYEYYSELDHLGRCGVVYACVGKDLMPTEDRGSISHVKPSGWQTVKYDNVSGKYLYNRSHLIGHQLAGEDANEKNLITGTRYMNVDGMLPFENMVADYVKETGNHVMYRVTPIYEGDNLVASGVQMEAKSVEDQGDGVLFHVFCYNVQPGIRIDYATGESSLDDGSMANATTHDSQPEKEEVKEPEPEPEPAPTYACSSCGTSYSSQAEADTCNASHVQAPEEPQEAMVWISETGSKYHSINDCGRMNPEKAYQMSESEAQQSYGRCSKCW